MKNIDGAHESLYKDVTVDWQKHKPPVLIVYEDGEEVERFRLDKFNDVDLLHKLMANLGFEKGEPPLEVDPSTGDVEADL